MNDVRYSVAGILWSGVMTKEFDVFGRIAEIELCETAAITVEQIDDEITVVIASQVTADQALKLSWALALAAENAAKLLASAET